MRRICVFCGSRPGVRPAYREAAEALGRLFAERGIELVYGGGNVGLMGIVADSCRRAVLLAPISAPFGTSPVLKALQNPHHRRLCNARQA